jgi:membrane fusion protein, heavy metal efflux system
MNTSKITPLILTLVFAGFSANARCDNTIPMSQQQIDNLGIVLSRMASSAQVPLFSAPAKVTVPPAHEVVVSTSQAGLIVNMRVAVGDKVGKGEVLAEINSPDLLTLQGNYLKAVEAFKLAEANYARDKTLRKEGVVSARNEMTSLSAFHAAAVEVKEAGQLLKIAGMNAADIKRLDQTGKLASQISVRAPIAGRVIERMAATGSRVDNLAPLYRLANLDPLWLEINIPQEHIGNLKIGDRLQIGKSQGDATVTMIGQSVNAENQTIPARALIISPSAAIRVGQKVTVQAIRSSEQGGYLVPDRAISRNAGKSYVFIRTSDGFQVREVAILGKQDEASVINGELHGDEEVAVQNTVTLKAKWLGLGEGE